jgi:thiol-disulfide isomerase/thioredoxin
VGPLLQLVVMAAGLRLSAGAPAPRLEALTFEGNAWSEQLAGRVTIVDFFATWCPHCRESLAGYARLKATRDVRVIIVDVEEEPALVGRFFVDHPPPEGVGVLLDPTGAARRAWGVTVFPTAYLIDQSGVIRGSFSGWGDSSGHRLAKQIDALQRPVSAAPPPTTSGPPARGKQRPVPRATTLDERARQMGVEVIR